MLTTRTVPQVTGCLAHPESLNCAAAMDSIAAKKSKEAFNALCKKLLDVLTEEKQQLSLSQKVRILYIFTRHTTRARAAHRACAYAHTQRTHTQRVHTHIHIHAANCSLPQPPTLTAATITALLQQFGSETLLTAKHRGILQIAYGVAESLRLAKEGLWEKLLSIEKVCTLTP